MNGLRLVGALVLALQLNQLAAPVLCAPARLAAPCHETSRDGVPQLAVTVPGHATSCPQSAMCGAPGVGVPATVIIPIVVVTGHVAPPAGASLLPGDAAPPLSPPPQA